MEEHTKIKNESNETLKAGCVVVNDKNEVLLVTDHEKKIRSFPKGHAEHGKTLEQVASREVREETGFSVGLIKRLSDVTYAHGQTGELIRVAMFLAEPVNKVGTGEDDVYSEWFSVTEAKKIIYPNLAFLLDQIQTKILIFLHGTTIMHSTGNNQSREIRVEQSARRDREVLDYASYIPVENAVEKIDKWKKQGANISYLSSHEDKTDVEKDRAVLKRFNFPDGDIFYRTNGESYATVVERVMPDILIEDDCESIGGKPEMTHPNLRAEIKSKIKSIVVKEFQGIDHLPDNLNEL